MKVQLLHWVKKNRLTLIGVLVGVVGGFLYWKFVGCASGQCPITSSPVNSSLYGALMGGLLFSMFKRKETNGKDEQETNSIKN
jgi:hypothetical protein